VRRYEKTDEPCPICHESVEIKESGDGLYEDLVPYSLVEIDCCKRALMHHECAVVRTNSGLFFPFIKSWSQFSIVLRVGFVHSQRHASNSGFEYRCFLCRNADKFKESMQKQGVFVPLR
jgi:hypothetical protein